LAVVAADAAAPPAAGVLTNGAGGGWMTNQEMPDMPRAIFSLVWTIAAMLAMSSGVDGQSVKARPPSEPGPPLAQFVSGSVVAVVLFIGMIAPQALIAVYVRQRSAILRWGWAAIAAFTLVTLWAQLITTPGMSSDLDRLLVRVLVVTVVAATFGSFVVAARAPFAQRPALAMVGSVLGGIVGFLLGITFAFMANWLQPLPNLFRRGILGYN
jgi:hypothetical protein